MTMPKNNLDDKQAAIDHHIGEAHKAAQLASAYLSDAIGPKEEGMSPEQWLEISYFRAAIATAASRVADTHARLLELKLEIGGAAL